MIKFDEITEKPIECEMLFHNKLYGQHYRKGMIYKNKPLNSVVFIANDNGTVYTFSKYDFEEKPHTKDWIKI